MIKNFDIKRYLESRETEYHVEGEKNVTRGWVNINCPFPGCDDPSWHCGINLNSKLYNCYICGSKGGSERLVMVLDGCSYNTAIRTIRRFPEDYIYQEETKERKVRKVKLPLIERTFHKRHFDYLTKRGFYAEQIINKYNLKSVYNIGDYKFRIIIPYFYNKELVTFNTRDITGKSKYPYLFLNEEDSILPVKQTLYNIDTVKDRCIITEGPTDVWRMGDGVVAVSGKMFTKNQILMLKIKDVRKCLILYDADDVDDFGKSIGEKLANNLSGVIPWVELIGLETGDPAELDTKEVNKIRNIIF